MRKLTNAMPVLCLVLSLSGVGIRDAAAQTFGPAPPVPIPGDGGQVRMYTHPDLGYAIAVPPGDQLLERDDDSNQIAIRSRNGYKISLQTGKTQRSVPLESLPSIIEQTYFGEGRPWHAKLDESHLTISGLPAFRVSYEGANNRSQVVFIRGRELDFVFVFVAGQREFPKHAHVFEWVLESFVPSVSGPASPKAAEFQTRAVKFDKPGFGYTMLYPNDWEMTEPAAMTVMFSGKPGSRAYANIVSVQNIEPPRAVSSEQALSLAVGDLRSSLKRSAPDIRFSLDRAWTYRRGDAEVAGRELAATYTHNGKRYRKVAFVVPRPFQRIAHIWSYTAPEQEFAALQPLAESMFRSWTMTGTGR